ncbi:MAG: DivIVA domain-containing protein [Acidimicrobiales bacterium]|jgi:TolA-binding protein
MDSSPYGANPDPSANGYGTSPYPSAPSYDAPPDVATYGYPTGPGAPENNDVDSAEAEIRQIASAIEELQGRLERANSQLSQATAVQTTEIEIGRLFVEAQRFSEASLSRLEMQVQEIVLEAEAKAAEIIREATEEAQEIRRIAQQGSPVGAGTAQELKTVIGAFASVNGELIKELNALNAMLTPLVDRRSASFAPPPSTMGSV